RLSAFRSDSFSALWKCCFRSSAERSAPPALIHLTGCGIFICRQPRRANSRVARMIQTANCRPPILMETIPALLQARLRAALADTPGADPKVSPSTDARFGDYQTNAAMILAKQQRSNPRLLAQQIIGKLQVSDVCEPPEIAGAGFINFRLKS